MAMKDPETVGVVGLGYVGLPLACAFGRVMPTVGFDVNDTRVDALQKGEDKNGEVTRDELGAPYLSFTADHRVLVRCDAFIVAVPTPTDRAKRPDLSYLMAASRLLGEVLQLRAQERGDAAPVPVIVYESTVYPGCTETDCVPTVEAASGLRCGVGFKVGYSPERINPGDKEHTFENIVKVVSGQDPETLDFVTGLYSRVVKAGVHRAPTIQVAEAAKVIENTQRDINIALMNELAMLFRLLNINTLDVLEAAGTKWNFLPFRPGLVGGHCIPEDPYYLTHKAAEAGYHPQLILAGRRLNDGMGQYVAQETVKLLIKGGHRVRGARVLILGVTFKENVPDVRNTRVTDIARELEEFGCTVLAFDPIAGDAQLARLGLRPSDAEVFDCIILAVPHRELLTDMRWKRHMQKGGILIDVKGVIDPTVPQAAGWDYWRL